MHIRPLRGRGLLHDYFSTGFNTLSLLLNHWLAKENGNTAGSNHLYMIPCFPYYQIEMESSVFAETGERPVLLLHDRTTKFEMV
jgi:hypothetical protein